MDAQPPEDPSALVRKVAELQAEISGMKTELTEIKRLLSDKARDEYWENAAATLEKLTRDMATRFPLTHQPNNRYYHDQESDIQGENQEELRTIDNPKRKQAGRPRESPYVREGEQAICTRCGHTWIPFVRRPKQCPACRQTWYKPKAWTRNKSVIG